MYMKESIPNFLRRTSEDLALEADGFSGLTYGLRRALSWPVPPNWSFGQWQEELQAVGMETAWLAQQAYDADAAISLTDFVSFRVASRSLHRYRQEWRFALRVVPLGKEIEQDPAGTESGREPELSIELRSALEKLHEPERWLIDQLYFVGRTESEIASGLGISQPAVSKRKYAALRHLRSHFSTLPPFF